MKNRTFRTALGCLSVCALLASAAAPAHAGNGERRLDLDLEQALKSESLTPVPQAEEAGRENSEPSKALRVEEFRLHEAAEAYSRSEAGVAAAAAAEATPKRHGFGRWLKKHWYVPVLVGAAIGFAVSDDSDDPNEIDD